jgi:hypothetical protein
MSFINGNTNQPVDATYIGYYRQTQPFTTTNVSSGQVQTIYDTYVIPKGVWLITANCSIEYQTSPTLLTDVNVRVLLPNNIVGNNVFVFGQSSPGFILCAASATEPFYSDGTAVCGIWTYATTTDSGNYSILGTNNTTMTYVKIA